LNVGDLFWVDLPSRGGHAQSGRRPALIVQSAAASVSLPTVLVVPLTTQREALRFPGTLLIEPDTQNGLPRPSVALVFQMSVLDRRFVGERVGSARDEVLRAVWAALDELMDRSSLRTLPSGEPRPEA
jgi:mRNA interferase MazF